MMIIPVGKASAITVREHKYSSALDKGTIGYIDGYINENEITYAIFIVVKGIFRGELRELPLEDLRVT